MTELARCGVHPRIIQQRAGHSSLATTQRYIEVTPDQERQAVRAFGSKRTTRGEGAPPS
jgi:integrase/recombinase XerD